MNNLKQVTSMEEPKRQPSVGVAHVIEHQTENAPVENENKVQLRTEEEIVKNIKIKEMKEVVTGIAVLPQVAAATESVEPLRRGQVYSKSQLTAQKIIFGRININRDVDLKEVRKKIKSIKEAKGMITPLLIIPAKVCLDQKLDICDDAGNVVTYDTENLEKIYIIIDGQHRHAAIQQLNKDGVTFEAYYMLPLNDCAPVTMLKEVNTAVNPWDGIDWLTMGIETAKNHNIDTKRMVWYKDLANTTDISNSAASIYASGNPLSIVSKAQIQKAINEAGKSCKLAELANVTGLDRNKTFFNAVNSKLTSKIAGLKIVPKTLYTFINNFVAENKGTIEEAHIHVTAFINSLTEEQTKAITGAKKQADKTKDMVLEALLNQYYNEYQTSLSTE